MLRAAISESGVARGGETARRLAALVVAVALAVTGAGLIGAPRVGAEVPGPVSLDEAKAEVVSAQQSADAAAVRYEVAIDRSEELADAVAALAARIDANRIRVRELREIARQRAIAAYVGRDSGLAGFLVEGNSPLDGARREQLLASTRERENTAIAALGAITSDLKSDRADLERQRAEQEQVLADLQADQERVQAKLRDAQHALDALEAILRQLEDAKKAQEIAASVARSASNHANGKSYTGVTVVTGLVCPVRGAVSFIDSWGAPRHQGAHMGVDLMSPRGTPDVAVVAGAVTYKSGGTSGNGAYLHGDDGHLYYYFHLDSYEGGPRHVAQGDVIGYVGNTGDAQYTATHTHFEIHPNGGAAVNPYPSVRAVC
jgi:murein DD-endopeptidase MepM/ murein hydrolase activator NlpD